MSYLTGDRLDTIRLLQRGKGIGKPPGRGGGGKPPKVSPVGYYANPTHLFLFTGDHSSGVAPVDSKGNATSVTNTGVLWEGGYANGGYPPAGGIASFNQATQYSHFRFGTVGNWSTWKTSWTWECFFFASSNATNQRMIGYGSNNWDNSGGGCFMIYTTNRLGFYQPGVVAHSDTYHTIARDSTWRHAALCYDGTYLYYAYNGVISRYSGVSIFSALSAEIYQLGGAGGGVVTDRGVNGMDAVRIVHGAALYTGVNGTTYTIPKNSGLVV